MQPQIQFREQALRHHVSPEELDRPLRLIKPRAWVALLGFAGLCAVAVAWSLLGRVPETVEGSGVLIARGSLRMIETPYDGVYTEILAKVGDEVSENAVLARLYQGEIERQLTQAKLALTELQLQDKRQKAIEDSRVKTEATLRVAREKVLQKTIDELNSLIADLQNRTSVSLRTRREQIAKNQEQLKEHGRSLRERLESARRLISTRLVTADTVLSAESSIVQNQQQLADLEGRLGDIDLKELDTRQTVVQQMGRISEFQVQRRELALQEIQTAQELARNQASRDAFMREQQERVKLLEARLEERRTVRSPVAGRILELAIQPGQTAVPGSRIGLIEKANSSSNDLRVVAYFTVGTGKRIQEGMAARVTPSTVQRERYGSIIGVVKRVSAYPVTEQSSTAGVGNPEVAQGLRRPGGAIEVEVELEKADTPTGYRWTSAGPPTKFTRGTTAQVRVTVEERAPISYLIPMIRGWLQGGQD